MEDLKALLQWLLIAFGLVMLIYFMWTVGRQINYSLSYEDMVRKTVCETVSSEYLKGGACDEADKKRIQE